MDTHSFRADKLIHGGDYNPDQWLAQPEIIDEDFRLMELAGINSATLGVFSWKKLEPAEGKYDFGWLDQIMDRMAAAGRKVILAAPSGARPAWMDRDHPECLRVSSERVRNLHGVRHNHCFTSPYYRKKTVEMNTLLARRYGNHPALYMWHVNNEYSGECHCQLCQEAFRGWLRKKYHNNIDMLNEQWWTGFWSHGFDDFSQIESPSERGESQLQGLRLDWQRFVSAQTIDFFVNESRPFRELTPDVPVTTNLMGLYKELNPWKMAPHMDIVSWDAYPEWGREQGDETQVAIETAFCHDIMRSMKGQPFYLMEITPSIVNWRQVNKLKKPGMHKLASMQAIAHGADSVQYFQWRKSRGANEKFHGAVVDHSGRSDTRVFQEVSALGQEIERLHELAGSDVPARAAVIYDWENGWAIENMQGWRTPRLYDETVIAHYGALRRLGLDVDIIDEETDLTGYRLIVAPMLYMLRSEIGAGLRQFVKSGNILLLTYGSGQVNENDLCYLGGFPSDGLMEVAGVWAEEIDTLYDEERNGLRVNMNCGFARETYEADSYCELVHPLENCEVLAEYTQDFYAGSPVLTRNVYGQGICYYLAARAEEAFLTELHQRLAMEAGLVNSFGQMLTVAGRQPEGVFTSHRQKGQQDYYFVLNFSGQPQTCPLPSGARFQNMIDDTLVSGSVELGERGYAVLRPMPEQA